MSETAEQLKSLMVDLFKCAPDELKDDTGPGDINGWDSLGHVALMAEIQSRFGTHIPVEDAIEVESVTDIVAIIDRLKAEG